MPKVRKYKRGDPLVYFAKYRWYLKALNAKKAEYSKILADIHSGEISRDTLDPFWKERIKAEVKHLKKKLAGIETTVESLPDTPDMMACKLFLRLHYILGMNMTMTAEKMNVSPSTVTRIKARTASYFEEFPL